MLHDLEGQSVTADSRKRGSGKVDKEPPLIVQRMERVRQIRKMTSQRLSFLATDGTNGSYFSGLKNKGQSPSAEMIEKIAAALEVSPLLFFTDFTQIEPLNSVLKQLETADGAAIEQAEDLIAKRSSS